MLEAVDWKWAAGLIIWTVLVFRLGVGIGKLARASKDIKPIDPARISPTVRARINEALRDGHKIEAIRILRDDTGCGLAEGKATVDAMVV